MINFNTSVPVQNANTKERKRKHKYKLIVSYSWIFYLTRLSGMYCLATNKNPLNIILKLIFVSYIIGAFVYEIFYPNQSFHMAGLYHVTERIRLYSNIVTCLSYYYNSCRYQKYIRKIFRKFEQIDDDFLQFGVEFNYKKYEIYRNCIVIGTHSFMIVNYYLTNMAYFNGTWYGDTLLISNFGFPLWIVYVLYNLYFNIVWDIKIRYDQINGLIEKNIEILEGNGPRLMQMIKKKMFNIQQIYEISKIYEELCETILNTTKAWGVTSVLSIGELELINLYFTY